MNIKYWVPVFTIGLGLGLTACIDDKYDLSDIDSTVQVNVKDLVIPVNIDVIKMSSILKVKEGDKIQIIDGKYTVVDSGNFNSDAINVARIELEQPVIDPTVSTINLVNGGGEVLPSGEYVLGEYSIGSDPSNFTYDDTKLDDAIIDIDSLVVPMTLSMTVTTGNLHTFADKLSFRDVVVQLPAGMDVTDAAGGSYNPTTGELSIAQFDVTSRSMVVEVKASAFDFKKVGGVINTHADGSKYATIKNSCYVKSGIVKVLSNNSTPVTLPNSIDMDTQFALSNLVVAAFTGTIEYNLEGVDIESVDLADLPDVFSQQGTSVRLANPRIYLHVDNPLQRYGLTFDLGFSLVSHSRYTNLSVTNSIDDGRFAIGTSNASGLYNFCLAPQPDGGISGYENAAPVKFTSLSNVLDADGIPQSISISLNDPKVPASRVSKLQLGSDLGSVDGRYKFLAPLELLDQSVVVYRDTLDGWGSDDLDHVTIQTLDINLNVSTDMPMKAKLTGYPIDSEGNRIGNVAIEGADIDVKAKNQPVKIHCTGEITHLDGIVFEAVVTAEGDPEVLSTDMSMTLTDVRPVVNGYYRKKL